MQSFVPDFLRDGIASFAANAKLNHKTTGMQSNRPIFKGELMINDEIGMRIMSGKVKERERERGGGVGREKRL